MDRSRTAEDWPLLPEEPPRLQDPPEVSQWAWYIPSTMRHSSFHEVASIEVLADEDEEPVTLVVVSCGRAWLVDDFAAVTDLGDPVLARSAAGTHAMCPNCLNGRKSGLNHWARRLEAARLVRRR